MEKVIIKAEWPLAKKVHTYINAVFTGLKHPGLKHLSIEDVDAILDEGIVIQKLVKTKKQVK